MTIHDRPPFAAGDGCTGLLKHVVSVGVGATAFLVPQSLGIGGEALVEPSVRPVPAGDQVAPPLMGQLVGDDALRRAVEQRPLIEEDAVRHGGGTGVLHAAAELIGADLGVLVPRIADAEPPAEIGQHVGRSAEGRLRLGACPLGT